MSKKISCGIIIINDNKEILLCHVTGNNHWDIPKGLKDENESEIEAAIRETREETGFLIEKQDLKDLGEFNYNKEKNLYLFKYEGNKRFNIYKAECTSTFEHYKTKKLLPEVDDFKFFNKNEAFEKSCKSLSKVLKNIL